VGLHPQWHHLDPAAKKLVGTGAVGKIPVQGSSVALSGDGNTAIVGGPGDNIITGAAWVFVRGSPGRPFSTFSAGLAIRLGAAPGRAAFLLQSGFTLGEGSDGINPLAQPVTLRVGTLTMTIPPGSFTGRPTGPFNFAGVIDGASLVVLIRPTGTKQYAMEVQALGATLTGTTNPVTVMLAIGGNNGTASVNTNIH
jgi:hypothetical protein